MRSKFKWIFTLLVALTMQFSFAQEKTVTGVVSDEIGPIAGANVVVKGTTRGTTTDFDGNYAISAKPGEVLEVSYVGYANQEVTVGAANAYNVSLTATLLEEVVVTGIVGVKRKAEAVTSAYQKVDKGELTQAANPNAISALQGKVTGLQINTTNNGVNQSNSIVLRGVRSMSGSNEALIVIDNVQSTNEVLTNLSPELIESVNVLKGGQAAALYGEKGVNGVIVVTTKKGSADSKISVDINSSITFENVSYMAQRQERYGQGWSGNHVSYENGAWGAEMDGVVRPVGLAQADGSYIMAPYSPIEDNIKEFFQTGTVFQNGVTIGGGTLKDGYALLSVNNQQTEFVVENDQLRRTTGLFKGGKQMGKWTVEGNVQFVKSTTNTTNSSLLTELYQAATNIPIQKFRNSGNSGHWTSYYRNPYWVMDNERYERRLNYIAGQATVGYKFNDNISVNYLLNLTSRNQDGQNTINGYTDNLQVGGGDHTTVASFSQFNNAQFKFYSDLVFNFDYELTEDLDFGLNLGLNLQDTRWKVTSVGGENLTIPGLYTIDNVENPDQGTNFGSLTTGNWHSRSKSYAYFANLDLGFRDFLFLNATARLDANSDFIGGSEDYSYFYPSVGLSFVPTKAFDGLKGNKVLNFAKLYGSYTKNGNSSILGVYDINQTLSAGSGFPFGDSNSFGNNFQVTDNGLRPEFMTTTELGFNLGFLKDRITLDFAVYKTVTDDLITNISPSYTSGNSRVLTNIGQMTNKGLEIDLGFTPIKTDNFKWENRVGFTTYKSIVDKVSNQSTEVALVNFADVGIFAVEGEEFPLIKGTAYERDDQGRVIVDPSTGNPIKAEGLKVLGKANPDFILNYNTSVSYKGFRLAAVMDYRTGHQFYSGTKSWLSWSGHLYESAVNGRTGFIFPNSSYESSPGVYTANTNIVTGGNSYSTYLSYFQDEYSDIGENFVLDATAFKVRELSLSYTFNKDMIKKAKLSNLQIGVNARNPFVVLPEENRGYSDPEFSRSSGNDKGISVVGQYPTTRTFAFTLNASF